MKRLVFHGMCLALIAAPVSGHAQESPTDAGVYSLSGSIGYVESLDHDNFDRELTFAPNVMYFVAHDLALGVSVLYRHLSSDSFDEDSYGVGPSTRWYLRSDGIKPFVSGAFRYGKIDSDFNDGTNGSDTKYWEGDVQLGLDFFLARNVAIEPTIGYAYRDFEDDGIKVINRDSNSLEFHIGINVFIF